jgi:hypothetical protein
MVGQGRETGCSNHERVVERSILANKCFQNKEELDKRDSLAYGYMHDSFSHHVYHKIFQHPIVDMCGSVQYDHHEYPWNYLVSSLLYAQGL